jgi:hypothetical protein
MATCGKAGSTGKVGPWQNLVASRPDEGRHCIENPSDTQPLEDYWQEFQLDTSEPLVQSPDSPDVSVDSLVPQKQRDQENGKPGYKSTRQMSTASVFVSGTHSLTPHHPAAKLVDLLHLFGPLIFPLYRAALLRKRILFVSEAPVELACNIVYNLSILATYPRSLLAQLPNPRSTRRGLRPLFNVGVHDIPALTSTDGWIACTTDDVLASKPDLYDVVVFLPGANARQAARKQYPKILMSTPELLKSFPRHGARSTQRDASRYQSLVRGLKRLSSSTVVNPEPALIPLAPEGPVEDTASVLTSSTIESRKEVVEPASWSQVAYTSLLWWASAGARRDGLSEEEEDERDRDEMLLDTNGDEGMTKEVAIVGFFRRLTSLIFSVLNQIIREGESEAAESSDDVPGDASSTAVDSEATRDDQKPLLRGQTEQTTGTDEEEAIEITSEDMANMALDAWSSGDRKFVEEFVEMYWQRRASVRGGHVECCGVRIL